MPQKKTTPKKKGKSTKISTRKDSSINQEANELEKEAQEIEAEEEVEKGEFSRENP
ncbi:MAG: hypothetical protein ACYC7D_10690 [Nitrososphaerales archaeon]